MITMYSKSWCGDCIRSKQYLEDNNIEYHHIDVEKESQHIDYVRKVNDGMESVPTIVFPDGSLLVEPTNRELEQKLIDNDLLDHDSSD